MPRSGGGQRDDVLRIPGTPLVLYPRNEKHHILSYRAPASTPGETVPTGGQPLGASDGGPIPERVHSTPRPTGFGQRWLVFDGGRLFALRPHDAQWGRVEGQALSFRGRGEADDLDPNWRFESRLRTGFGVGIDRRHRARAARNHRHALTRRLRPRRSIWHTGMDGSGERYGADSHDSARRTEEFRRL